jgi:hypothetical protein
MDDKLGLQLGEEAGKPIAQVARELGINEERWATGALRIGGDMVRVR